MLAPTGYVQKPISVPRRLVWLLSSAICAGKKDFESARWDLQKSLALESNPETAVLLTQVPLLSIQCL